MGDLVERLLTLYRKLPEGSEDAFAVQDALSYIEVLEAQLADAEASGGTPHDQ